MSWSYSGVPNGTPLNQVRFIIADTDESDPKLQDEEINSFLLMKDSVNKTALTCIRFIIAKAAQDCNIYIGPERVFASQRFTQYTILYKFLQQELTAGTMTPQQEDTKPIFNVGMMDHWGL